MPSLEGILFRPAGIENPGRKYQVSTEFLSARLFPSFRHFDNISDFPKPFGQVPPAID